MQKIFWVLVLGFFFSKSTGQEVVNYDRIYAEYIRSVQFHPTGLPLTPAIVDLKSNASLTLRFDDVGGDGVKYRYRLVHCDRNWEISDLDNQEFINGFNDQEIRGVKFSVGTLVKYSHYSLQIPNKRCAWRYSGNYLLHIYEDGKDDIPVLTRRFMVVEQNVKIGASFERPAFVSKQKTHHEIDFSADFESFNIANPNRELFGVILKNGSWDEAIVDIKPRFIRGKVAMYDYQNKLTIPAGKMYRRIDARSIRFRGFRVDRITKENDGIDYFIEPEYVRTFKEITDDGDMNGKFFIETQDDDDDQVKAEYVYVHLHLAADEYDQGEIYVFGALTDWEIAEEYKMTFNTDLGMYQSELFLKQGMYDYQYVLVKDGEIDKEALEGNWYQTLNNYNILIYYNPFGGRYDQLIGATTVSTSF